jgi:tetratricopeptide (TPR) repeat protein
MSKKRFLVGLPCLLILVGCAGVGIVATSDPLTKLNDAEDLFMRQDRPLPAERLIQEAIVIYQERDDPHGLGNAHREYADLLRSPSITGKWEKFYRENGFQDKSVTFENRMAKSSEYYSKALGYYARAETKLREANRFDSLTNVYFNMAWSYYRLEDRVNACAFYDRTLEAYTENIKRNPSAKPYSSTGSVPELVESMKKRAACV